MSAPNIVRALRLQRASGEFVLDRPAADYIPRARAVRAMRAMIAHLGAGLIPNKASSTRGASL
jgi:hypothetical protein